jgi:tRNA U34 5-methylaminomethyl-2-thiouridine-forming methyltransferase MnmC
VSSTSGYRIVNLANGAHSVRSLAHGETFHPVIGPVAEAQALYVSQLGLLERIERHTGEFVIWDVGLGAAANPVTILRATERLRCSVQLVSFDHTLEPLEFALKNTHHLNYLLGYEKHLSSLLQDQRVSFEAGEQKVRWEVHVADFPTLLTQSSSRTFAKPHAIMFDAFSPAKNPAMWTQPLFASLFRLLDPNRPCAMPTYSRSTMLRVTLLLAGFFVGVGRATGEKEETTVATNSLKLIERPLDRRWLQRAHRSTSAEPMWEPVYRQSPLQTHTWARLAQHPQFRQNQAPG